MQASRDREFTHAFVLTSDELRKLVGALREGFPKITFVAQCADTMDRKFDNVDEVLAYENAPRKAIKRLRIRAYGASIEHVCIIRLDNNEFRNISLSIIAPEKVIEDVSESLEERIASMTPWYKWVAAPSAWMWLTAGPVLLYFTIIPLSKMWMQGKLAIPDFSTLSAPGYFLIALIAFVAALVVAERLFEKFRRILFPMGVFAIGQGERRHENLDKNRIAVALAFVVSVAAGIVTSWFT